MPALHALHQISQSLAPVLRICEVRVVAGDQLWLSPCYQRDSAAFHFTWINDWPAVAPVLAEVEERLAPGGVQPLWGYFFLPARCP